MGYVCTPLGDTPPDTTDRLAAPTEAELLPSFLALLPRGRVWQDGRWAQPTGSTVLHKFFKACAAPFADLYALAHRVAQGSTIATADPDFFEDWETELGMPGPCMQPGTSIEARRKAMRVALLSGGASPAYFICLASRFGFYITVEDGRLPFEAGRSECGGEDGCLDDELTWIVTGERIGADKFFEAGLGEAGLTPLGERPIRQDLECLISHYAPAHTTVVFRYTDLSIGDGMTIDTSVITVDSNTVTVDEGVANAED